MKNFQIILEHKTDQENAFEKLKQLKSLGNWNFVSKDINFVFLKKDNKELSSEKEEEKTKLISIPHQIDFITEIFSTKDKTFYFKVETSSYFMDIQIKIDEKFIKIEGSSLHMVKKFSDAIKSAFEEVLNILFVKKIEEIKEGG